ncbi:MAG: twin-arginine translocase TatA/TatE family subunit [Myxococcaceae bacterium]|nr:twin-arginine translocase TatA/TatE family subunit [Myxococcaceae bacterium]
MFNIGAGEMIFILVAALLILGPQRLPELARGIGKFLREFRRQTDEVRSVVTREFYQMDQELQREPPRTAPPAPVPPLEEGTPGHSALPPPSDTPAPGEGGIQAHPQPEVPEVPVPEEGIQASVPVAPPEAAPGEPAAEQETALPRFEPIPGTVARNAPKQG